MEVVAYLRPPSPDVKLVAFAGGDIYKTLAEVHEHLKECAAYAKRYHVYLVTGLLIHNHNLCLCLIGPEGDLVKTYVLPFCA